MSLNAVRFREKIEEKWKQRSNRHADAKRRDFIPSLKLVIVCKCPRCEIEHEMPLRWTGRGTPRIFCPNCRPTITSISDSTAAIPGVNRSRRGIYRDDA